MSDDPARDGHIRALLAGHRRWHTLRWEAEVGSTNDEVAAAARTGASPGLVIVADRQTAGRGRAGRRWEDPPDGRGSVAISALVAPAPGATATLVPLAAGLAVCDAVAALGLQPRLKWPNDVLLPVAGELRKTAGILVEQHELAGRDLLIVGIGIDLDWRAVARDASSRAWTSLAEGLAEVAAPTPVHAAAIVAAVLGALDQRLVQVDTAAAELLAAYRTASATLGAPVEILRPDGHRLRGVARDVTGDGALLLEVAGARQEVHVGDVTHLRPG